MYYSAMFMLASLYVAPGLATKSALIIIDVQNCFLPGGTLEITGSDVIIPVINDLKARLESRFELVVLTQDWHCSNHVSFASQHPGYDVLDKIALRYNARGDLCRSVNVSASYAVSCDGQMTSQLEQTLWPDHCVINTPGAEFSAKLNVSSSDVIVRKGYHCQVDSYSGFYDNGWFEHTELDEVLRASEVSTVYLTGLAIDFCLYFTAKDAIQLGYETYVVMDATTSIAPDTSKIALDDMRSLGAKFIDSSSVESTLTSGGSPVWLHTIVVFIVTLATAMVGIMSQ